MLVQRVVHLALRVDDHDAAVCVRAHACAFVCVRLGHDSAASRERESARDRGRETDLLLV